MRSKTRRTIWRLRRCLELKKQIYLNSFLNDIFDGVHEKIEDVEFLKLNQDPEVAAYRQSIVDVKCSDTQGKTVGS